MLNQCSLPQTFSTGPAADPIVLKSGRDGRALLQAVVLATATAGLAPPDRCLRGQRLRVPSNAW